MKSLVIILFSTLVYLNFTFAQTTLTVDANGILNSTKIITQTANGQSFFTGHQLGSGYSYPTGIFRAITDNPNGQYNYFFDGVAGSSSNFSVRADGQGYFAGSLGIGTGNFQAKFNVYQSKGLGSNPQNYSLLSTISGLSGTGNVFQNNIWLVRNATGSDWYTTRLHDGISIDVSFLSPQQNTQTWWERDPSHNIQSWGNANSTYLTINNGNVGLGTVNPSANLEVSKNTIIGTGGDKFNSALTVIKNGDQYGIDNPLLILKHSGVGSNSYTNPISDLGIIQIIGFNTSIANKAINSNNNFFVFTNGTVGINTNDTKGYQLAVNGSAIATSMIVKLQTNWPDYVFTPTYTLPTLGEVKTYIDQNHHLPEIPSEEEVLKNGINLGEMNKLLIKKIEELTLYLIEKDKKEKEQAVQLKSQQAQIDDLNKKLEILMSKN